MAEEAVIRLAGVWVKYNDLPVLEDINLTVNSHDFMGIIGPNGGGKTTLLKVMLGLVNPSRGEVNILGEKPEKGRRHVGYVPQQSLFAVGFPISVAEVVIMGRYSHSGLFRPYNRNDHALVKQALETVGMIDYANRQIGQLSGGQQQRVFIARALVSQPRVLLLDEPTASIDSSMQSEFYALLKKLSQNMAIVMVSHDISAISVYVDKIVCLNRKLFYHGLTELPGEILEATYQCPLQFIGHGAIPHRVLSEHSHD
jgi:zinc transport system ATP-binding protein